MAKRRTPCKPAPRRRSLKEIYEGAPKAKGKAKPKAKPKPRTYATSRRG